jgi:hypothetical protein
MTKEDLIVISKEEYEMLGRELTRLFLINFRYQARCTCDIDFSNFTEDNES